MNSARFLLSSVAATLWAAPVETRPGDPWPGGIEIGLPVPGGESDLSGATWNTESESLWVVRQNGQVWEYGWDGLLLQFEELQTFFLPGDVFCGGIGCDIEAIAQVDHAAIDELYTLAEDNGRLGRVTDLFGVPTVAHVWNLEVLNNGNALPPETLGDGAEGLEFAPDASLLAAGFRYPDGSPFTGSVKGMGGLIFVGHQIGGRLHVFDVNPNVSDDFVNHGSFATSATEIAGLHFDRSTGRMFVWHNPGNVNSLEISLLRSKAVIGVIDTLLLYDSVMPAGNLEGIAAVGQTSCGDFGSTAHERGLFLTRDGGSPNLLHFEAFPCEAAGEVVRVGAPANPAAFLPGVTSGPVIGATWDPVLDHTTPFPPAWPAGFVPAAAGDFLLLTAAPLNFVLGAPGTLLCSPGPPLTQVFPAAPGVPFAIPMPNSLPLVGLTLCAQGGSIDAFGARHLANALDLTIGVL